MAPHLSHYTPPPAAPLPAGQMMSSPRPLYFLTRGDGTLTPLIALDELPPTISIRGVPSVISYTDTQGMMSLGVIARSERTYIVDLPNSSPIPKEEAEKPSSPEKSPFTSTHSHKHSQASIDDSHANGETSLGESPKAQETLPPSEAKVEPKERERNVENWRQAVAQPKDTQVAAHAAADADVENRELPKNSETLKTDPALLTGKKKVYCTYWMRHGECDYMQQGCLYKHEMPTDSATLHALGYNKLPRWWTEANANNIAASGWTEKSGTVKPWRPAASPIKQIEPAKTLELASSRDVSAGALAIRQQYKTVSATAVPPKKHGPPRYVIATRDQPLPSVPAAFKPRAPPQFSQAEKSRPEQGQQAAETAAELAHPSKQGAIAIEAFPHSQAPHSASVASSHYPAHQPYFPARYSNDARQDHPSSFSPLATSQARANTPGRAASLAPKAPSFVTSAAIPQGPSNEKSFTQRFAPMAIAQRFSPPVAQGRRFQSAPVPADAAQAFKPAGPYQQSSVSANQQQPSPAPTLPPAEAHRQKLSPPTMLPTFQPLKPMPAHRRGSHASPIPQPKPIPKTTADLYASIPAPTPLHRRFFVEDGQARYVTSQPVEQGRQNNSKRGPEVDGTPVDLMDVASDES